jgi:hypothetical protein
MGRSGSLRDGPPKLTPPAKLAGGPISDDKTVAKMGHAPAFMAERDLAAPLRL